jgi:hypothetical protein
MKEVMKTIGQSNSDDLDSVMNSSETYLVFNANELMGKGYEIFETNKVKYLSAKNGGDKNATDKAQKKLMRWMKETASVKSANNINTHNGDVILEKVTTENSSLSSADLTELCGINIG